jgi:hypothetical protein
VAGGKFLVLYDYGQGGVWAYVIADSAEDIRRAFPALSVHDKPPAWMKAEDLDALSASMTIDIADRHHPFLAALPKR